MNQSLFIGVDGGATKSSLRIEDAEGHLLGQAMGGPASIRISVREAWHSINATLNQLLSPLGIVLDDDRFIFHAGMGLAGCEIAQACEDFIGYPHPFHTLIVSSDSHVACLGAHGGEDGAIIIAGTGVVGYQIDAGQVVQVGGWGFPHDDEGGGAWLGLQATKITLQWLDGRLPSSELARAVYNYFSQNQAYFINWANQANSTAFAKLAPIVIQQSEAGCSIACQLLQQAAQAIDRIGYALEAKQRHHDEPLACSLVGGIAPFLHPFLSAPLRSRIYPCQSTPDAGAILLVHNFLAKDIQ